MLRPRNSMDLLSSVSLSESVTSTRAVFRRLKRALFGGAFLFPTESRSPCCSTRSIPIGGVTKEKPLHFLHPTEHLFWVKNQTRPSPHNMNYPVHPHTAPPSAQKTAATADVLPTTEAPTMSNAQPSTKPTPQAPTHPPAEAPTIPTAPTMATAPSTMCERCGGRER